MSFEKEVSKILNFYDRNGVSKMAHLMHDHENDNVKSEVRGGQTMLISDVSEEEKKARIKDRKKGIPRTPSFMRDMSFYRVSEDYIDQSWGGTIEEFKKLKFDSPEEMYEDYCSLQLPFQKAWLSFDKPVQLFVGLAQGTNISYVYNGVFIIENQKKGQLSYDVFPYYIDDRIKGGGVNIYYMEISQQDYHNVCRSQFGDDSGVGQTLMGMIKFQTYVLLRNIFNFKKDTKVVVVKKQKKVSIIKSGLFTRKFRNAYLLTEREYEEKIGDDSLAFYQPKKVQGHWRHYYLKDNQQRVRIDIYGNAMLDPTRPVEGGKDREGKRHPKNPFFQGRTFVVDWESDEYQKFKDSLLSTK